MDGHSEFRTALIADDDEFFRLALSKLLTENLNYTHVIETGSFDEALEYLNKNNTVSLALFDLSMPGIDSPAALRSIRETFDVKKVAVISGSRRRCDIITSLEAGVHGFIPKWLGVRELQHALETVLDGTVYVPASLARLDPDQTYKEGITPDRRSKEKLNRLTPRQMDVLRLLVEGQSTKEIARTLDLGLGTIKVHLAGLFRSLEVSNRAAAAAAGVRLLQPVDPQFEQANLEPSHPSAT